MAYEDRVYTTEEVLLLHDQLAYVLEDVTGHFYHEEEFERVWNGFLEKEN